MVFLEVHRKHRGLGVWSEFKPPCGNKYPVERTVHTSALGMKHKISKQNLCLISTDILHPYAQ